MKTMLKMFLILQIIFTLSCSDSSESKDDNSIDNLNILTTSHEGWGDKGCASALCHTLPVANHESNLTIPQCATCHGGNGACIPTINESHATRPCSNYNCHGTTHGYEGVEITNCNYCHFATQGTVTCPMK